MLHAKMTILDVMFTGTIRRFFAAFAHVTSGASPVPVQSETCLQIYCGVAFARNS